MPKGVHRATHDDQAEELEAVAKVDGVSVAEEIRRGATTRIAERRNDDELRKRLRRSIDDNKRILERLAR